MYHSLHANLILAYHGCDERVGKRLLQGAKFKPSTNDYDWLGPGIYFWEANPNRAWSFAKEQQARGRVKKPFVVGAVLSLGTCIDTLSESSIEAIAYAHAALKKRLARQRQPMPKNVGKDLLLKRLDCAVINQLHDMSAAAGIQKADSLRGLYFEGRPLYRTAAFYEKSHVQICIVNPACIKGVFYVPQVVS
ncbi:hypothetical protein IVA80_29175 [Bradyrhizobium sp. 139]|uniref:hypothetical protein n=1 Tax=Bradyrhizobium sp. 139 TaxID=2782616 RepID=UPI001FFA3C2E|nr:hypothetical protein [Bradyrhizobium sp. 139]MCK1744782.1 hypothetical protein [Bradyrhizobium sp. 139]